MPATYEPIATTTLAASASSITFSSISSSYTDLKVIWSVLCSQDTNLYARFNSDSGNNYSFTRFTGNGSTATSGRGGGRAQIDLAVVGSTGSGVTFCEFDIFSYSGSTNKTVLSKYNSDKNGSGAVECVVGLWRNTSAINSITLLPSSGSANLLAGTTATLYGILKA